ncbi:maleylpyruvate isomerase family mycothiol-dependent enzyme [Stackebrandtia soli]|uniref:maleylpyruvate isomerase family mycothiol-dependent enzyme n=1 Tax=Stackebrandtia soli TaxID=1892856 RepID=UPI0039E9229D
MGVVEHIEALQREGNLLAASADEVGIRAPIPTCPGWTIRDLLWHTGTVHRWAKTIVSEARSYDPPDNEIAKIAGPICDEALLVEWYRESLRQLVNALRDAPDDLSCWTSLPGAPPLAFWARRQAHETAIHRVDAESARGDEISPIGVGFAADGIDELLNGLHSRPKSRVRSPVPRVLRLHATDELDEPGDWFLHISDEPLRVTRSHHAPSDCTLSGPVELLYLAMWNRCRIDDLNVSGDGSLIKLWQETSPITWSLRPRSTIHECEYIRRTDHILTRC